MTKISTNLPPRQKTAILLMSLPPELSAQVFKELGPEEVQAITMEISKLPQISPEVRAQVIEEFLGGYDGVGAAAGAGHGHGPFGVHGGGERTFGAPFGAGAATMAPPVGGRRRPLDFLRRVDHRQILQLIRKEHPQTIALVLFHLERSQASEVLAELVPDMQTEVAHRLADIGSRDVAPDILQEVEKILEGRLHRALEEGSFSQTDGKETLLEILNQADRNTEEKILTGLTQKRPHLASDIKTKLCDFEDLNNIDDSSLQQVLRLTDFRDLVLALKGANRSLAERIYRFLSPEVSRALRDDVESLGQVPWEEIKAAQQQIRNILRGLVTLGKIKFK